MRNRFACLALAAATGLLACATEQDGDNENPPNPAEAEVIAAVDALFAAMFEGDSTALRSLLLPNAWLVAVDDAGTRPSDAKSFIARMSSSNQEFLERMWNPEVRIDGPIATLWTPYDFHRGGEFSHCGTDAAQLAYLDGAWRIQSIIYTVEREGCPESPLGPPSTGG